MARTSKQYQAAVVKNLATYKKGSRVFVELFVEGAERYRNEDSRSCDNLQFFANAIKDFPVLQKAMLKSLADFGKFKITNDEGNVTIVNRGKETEAQTEKYLAAIAEYKAKEYNSLLAPHQNQLMKAFDLDTKLKSFGNSATQIIVNALANDENLTKEQMIEKLVATVNALGNVDLSEKIAEKRAEIGADKITSEDIQNAANGEAAAESETVAA